MDAILVLMQVGHENDWTDRGVPEVVTGYDRAASPEAAGAEWMFDHHPTPVGDDWRLLIWTGVRSGAWNPEKPDAVVTPGRYRAAIAERNLRPSRIRRPKLVSVTEKIRVDEVDVGDRVLVTQNRQNTAVRGSTGPWVLANTPGPDCVATRVRGHRVLTGNDDTTWITLVTSVGEIDRLPTWQPVIPVDEE